MTTAREYLEDIIVQASALLRADPSALDPFTDDLCQIDEDFDGITDECRASGILPNS